MRRLLPSAAGAARALALAATVALAGCEGIQPAGFSGDVDVLLTRGAAFAATVRDRPDADLGDEEVIVLGYLERARLGVGSPFRLAELAGRDPDLSPERREPLAFALLAGALRGEGYRFDPSILEYVRLAGGAGAARSAAEQLRLVERTVAAAPTARSGERAIRLGYRLAEAEGLVPPVPYSTIAHVAAMVSDRRRAQEDARTLLRAAAARSVDPLELMAEWRRERRFQVERPVLDPSSVREEEWEAREAPNVARALRSLSQRLGARSSLVPEDLRGDERPEESVLSPAAAARLLALAEVRDHPPQAPIAVALGIHRDAFLDRAGLSDEGREARRRFVEGSWSEERLVAGARLLAAGEAGSGPRLPLIVLQAATFFRVWNQEEPWFPGDPAPAAREVEARFGLVGIEFDESVPTAWRPFYNRMLARGFSDLARVLPTASLRGLRVRIGPLPDGIEALALHEPASRTLTLPTHTGSGTLAHEVAHDLDWQLARKRYGRRGAYATDLSVRKGQGDRIASSLSGLAAALARPGQDTLARPHDTRPAEVFARGSDWLVAVMLARQGRTGGYLTSFQDAALTGYGTTRGPDVGGGAVPSLLTILDAIAPVTDGSRDWAFQQFGPDRTLSPTELVQPILLARAGASPLARMEGIASARDRALTSLSSASCRLSSAPGLRRLITAQRSLIATATAAALRGVAVEGVRELGREGLGPGARPRVDAWLARRLYGAPVPADSAVDALSPAFEELLYRAETIGRAEPAEIGSPFQPGEELPLCASNPFAAPDVPRPRRAPPASPAGLRVPVRTTHLSLPRALLPATPWHAVE